VALGSPALGRPEKLCAPGAVEDRDSLQGNDDKAEAVQRLGISEHNLCYKLEKHRL